MAAVMIKEISKNLQSSTQSNHDIGLNTRATKADIHEFKFWGNNEVKSLYLSAVPTLPNLSDEKNNYNWQLKLNQLVRIVSVTNYEFFYSLILKSVTELQYLNECNE